MMPYGMNNALTGINAPRRITNALQPGQPQQHPMMYQLQQQIQQQQQMPPQPHPMMQQMMNPHAGAYQEWMQRYNRRTPQQ